MESDQSSFQKSLRSPHLLTKGHTEHPQKPFSVQGLPGLALTSQASSKLGKFCFEGWPGKGRDGKEMAAAPGRLESHTPLSQWPRSSASPRELSVESAVPPDGH